MNDLLPILGVALAAFLVGVVIAWLVGRARLAGVEARREAEGRAAAERLELVERSARQQAVGELIAPMREALGRVEAKIAEAERSRAEAQGGLSRHLAGLAEAHARLSGETARLARALRAPAVRGRWGEVQLQRVVEIAGLTEHCDFTRQETLATNGGVRRPDLVVRLPAGRTIAVDAKAPLQHYLDAVEAADEERRRALFAEHARQIRRHAADLASRQYWDALDGTPELVVLFLPGEHFLSAALEHQPDLIERAGESRVVLATPTTLIAVLKAVAYGWRQERMADNAREVADLGRRLHDRLRVFCDHLSRVGAGLDRAVDAYNAAVGSLESRVLPGARRFQELGAAGGDELPLLAPVDRRARDAPDEPPADAAQSS